MNYGIVIAVKDSITKEPQLKEGSIIKINNTKNIEGYIDPEDLMVVISKINYNITNRTFI
ncbi:MAG: hypothetical protein PHX70_07905 [Clostridium sp.]|nr:hypothetical protein [Clostridium sp.]